MNWYDETEKTTIFHKLLDVVAPSCKDKDAWADALERACDRYNITDVDEIAMFVAQTSHESSDYNKIEENLNYTASRLMVVWPSRFKTLEFAKQYERNPRKLANYVYGSRYGNNPNSNDGYNYRGSGVIHLTFKDNYMQFAKDTDIDVVADPDLVRTDPYVAALTAAHYWHKRVTMGSLKSVTKMINGGENGLADRQRRYDLALSVIRNRRP